MGICELQHLLTTNASPDWVPTKGGWGLLVAVIKIYIATTIVGNAIKDMAEREVKVTKNRI